MNYIKSSGVVIGWDREDPGIIRGAQFRGDM